MYVPALALKHWFKKNARLLPWRETQDPYAIWVSEVMLQQTQVKTVLGYYQRWMQRFPTLKDLAIAPQEEVIKLWEGLGYYSRARNLQKGAKQILEDFAGIFPRTKESLLKIKGIGPYTAGALLSFAFHQRSTLIDGNVKRVFARFFHLEEDFSVAKFHKQLDQIAESILPNQEPWVFNEALMELGALICTPKKPACESCPMASHCAAKKLNKMEQLPLKAKRKKQVRLHRLVWIFEYDQKWAVEKKEQGVMQDLYEFPFEDLENFELLNQELSKKLSKFHIKPCEEIFPLPSFVHGYTHHRVTLYPYYIPLKSEPSLPHLEWVSLKQIQAKPFSAGHRKILKHLLKSYKMSGGLF